MCFLSAHPVLSITMESGHRFDGDPHTLSLKPDMVRRSKSP